MFFNDTKSISHHDWHSPRNDRLSTLLLCIQQNHEEMQARKLITYHFFCLLSFETHGIASVARLQREEVSRAKKEHGGTGTFSTGIYAGCASSVEFSSFLLVANHTANCSQIYWKYCIFRNSWQIQHKYNFFIRQWRSFSD
jgi:hypothetical protein